MDDFEADFIDSNGFFSYIDEMPRENDRGALERLLALARKKYEVRLGADVVREIFARQAPAASDSAGNVGMVGHNLSENDFEVFCTFLRSNPWKAASGKSPSEFIRTTCKDWLARGLALADVRKAQPDLALRYGLEISADPTRRIPDLYVKPHKAQKGTPSRIDIREVKHVADLSEAELLERRRQEREKKARLRAKKTSKSDSLTSTIVDKISQWRLMPAFTEGRNPRAVRSAGRPAAINQHATENRRPRPPNGISLMMQAHEALELAMKGDFW